MASNFPHTKELTSRPLLPCAGIPGVPLAAADPPHEEEQTRSSWKLSAKSRCARLCFPLLFIFETEFHVAQDGLELTVCLKILNSCVCTSVAHLYMYAQKPEICAEQLPLPLSTLTFFVDGFCFLRFLFSMCGDLRENAPPLAHGRRHYLKGYTVALLEQVCHCGGL